MLRPTRISAQDGHGKGLCRHLVSGFWKGTSRALSAPNSLRIRRAVVGACVGLLLPRLWSEQWHPPRPDPCINDGPGLQPGSQHTPPAAAGAAHAAQHVSDRCCLVERGQFGDREFPLTATIGRAAVTGEIDPRQLMQRAGENGDPLPGNI